jgi:hypothetical protein
MTPHTFVKVFDIFDSGFKDWTFPAFGLFFVTIGILMFSFPQIIKTSGKFFRYFYLGFAIFFTLIVYFSMYSKHQHHLMLAQENKWRLVEGPVENFVPMPFFGKGLESFSVSGVKFGYSDDLVIDGFNNTSSHGGPIKKDSYVRIWYDPSGNQILRLEIRYFKR